MPHSARFHKKKPRRFEKLCIKMRFIYAENYSGIRMNRANKTNEKVK